MAEMIDRYGDPIWPGVLKFSAEWRRQFRDWWLARHPNADEGTRRNLDMLIEWAEQDER
jgi:hypothetical protein